MTRLSEGVLPIILDVWTRVMSNCAVHCLAAILKKQRAGGRTVKMELNGDDADWSVPIVSRLRRAWSKRSLPGSLGPIVSGACTRLRCRLRGAAVENHRGGSGFVTGQLSKHLAWRKVMNRHSRT